MCYIDEGFGLLPGGQTLEVDAAVFGAEVMQIGAGIGDDAAVFQRGTDAALELTGLLIKKVEDRQRKLLPPWKGMRPARSPAGRLHRNVLDAGALRIHLAEQVDVHRIVDGDEVVQRGDAADIVGVIDGSRHALGVVVEVVVIFWVPAPKA